MSRIIFENQITLDDLAETINDQLDRNQIHTLLSKISIVIDDPDFDEAVREQFAAMSAKWS